MPSSCRPSLKTAAVVLLSLSLLAVLYFVIGSWAIFEFLAEACQWIRHNTFLGALLFIPCEAIWVVSCVPTTPLELAAGYAFGVGAGFVVDTLGKLLGCTVSFVLGRLCLRGLAARMCLAGDFGANLLRAVDLSLAAPANKKMDQLSGGGKAANGGAPLSSSTASSSTPILSPSPSWDSYQLLLLIQLAYIPVALKNYGLSLTAVSFGAFFMTSLLGEMPSTFAIVWTGASTADLVGLLSGRGHMTYSQIFATVLGALSLALLMGLLGLRVQQRLQELSPSNAGAEQDFDCCGGNSTGRSKYQFSPTASSSSSSVSRVGGADGGGGARETLPLLDGRDMGAQRV
jgi:uncharacterized membrane protein YdjX (TVP38/TMEM64 family)